ncbi:MAG: mannose-1-phosphate guanylyltransferase [Cecembia sp.]
METKHVIISQLPQDVLMGKRSPNRPNEFLEQGQDKSAFQLLVENNLVLCDKIMVIGQVSNFKFSRNALLKLGIYNYEEIIEASSKNTAADFAFAAFESNSDDILLISHSFFPIQVNDYYRNTIEHAKKMAANGDLVIIDFYPEDGSHDINDKSIPISKMYCFKAASYLEELQNFEPVIYFSVRRAHFKKSGSFINELLNELIPSQTAENAVFKKSGKVKTINAFLSNVRKSNVGGLGVNKQLQA